MEVNTAPATDNQPMSQDAAAEHLASLLVDSPAAPTTPDSEEPTEELEATEVTEAEGTEVELDAVSDEEPADEYEAEAVAADEAEASDYIEVDGEQITLDEVGKSYMRQADYTQKTQELAEQRKAFEAEQTSIAQEREHLKQMLEFAGKNSEPEPDWVQLATDDPLEYTRQRAIFDAKKAENEVATAERDRLNQIEAQQRQANAAKYVEEQKDILSDTIPELKGETGQQYRSDILTYMANCGWSKDEIGQMYDSRAVIAIDKARKYDAITNKGKVVAKKVKGVPKVVKPGVQTSKKAKMVTSRKKAQARARQSGSVDDAVAALLAL